MRPPKPRLTTREVLILTLVAAAMLVLPFLAMGDDEVVRVRIAAAKTISSLASQPESPDAPPNVVLNLKGEDGRPLRPLPPKPGGAGQVDKGTGGHGEKTVAEPTTPRNPRVVMLHAEWCGPCRVSLDGTRENPGLGFRKWLEAAGWEISHRERAHVQLIDIDQDAGAMQRFNVTSLPTFLLIEDGKERKRHVGQATRQAILSLFKARSDTGPPRGETPAKVATAGHTSAAGLVTVAGLSVVPWYESVNGQTVQATDEHLLHHGFTAQQIAAMKHDDRAFWHGLAHQLEASHK